MYKGYNVVNLYKPKRTTLRLSRLVKKTFDPVEDGGIVDHVNGIRNDDRLINLRWVNAQQNMRNTPYTRYLQKLLKDNDIQYLDTKEWFD